MLLLLIVFIARMSVLGDTVLSHLPLLSILLLVPTLLVSKPLQH